MTPADYYIIFCAVALAVIFIVVLVSTRRTYRNLHQAENETRAWENRELGNDARYARVVTDEEDKLLDESLGLQVVHIRMEQELVRDLDRMAAERGRADHVVLIRDLAQQARDQWLARRQ